jgi:hypothetical protein
MKISKPLRISLITLTCLLGLVVVFILVAVMPLDRDIDYKSLLTTMNNRIQQVDKDPSSPDNGLAIGFSKINLTPAKPIATAGYGKRLGKLYKSVHDSIYVRTMIVDNGIQRVAIVSADLLIIPPTVTALLEAELPNINFTLDNTYLGATHTHNSIGNWAKGLTALFYSGSFEDSIVRFIADKIKMSIVKATENVLPAKIRMDTVSIPEGVYNRAIDGGPVDPLLRYLIIERSDSSELLFISYTAHATCLFSRDLELSGDYPGRLLEIFESKGYDFAMFMAGAVGSHGPAAPEPSWSCVNWMAEKIADNVEAHKHDMTEITNASVEMYRVPLALTEIQPKILHDWRLRPWIFRASFGEYPSFLSVLRIGNIVLLGTPCDFSGEFNFALDSLAAAEKVFPIVTSFNGGYIGYLTPAKYYDVNHHETQLMNWYGPGNGEYVEQSLEKLMLSVTD